MSVPPKSALLAGICYIYTLQNINLGLSYTDMLVLLHLMLFSPEKVNRKQLIEIMPRDSTSISASLNRLQDYKLVASCYDDKLKHWQLTDEGASLAATIWNKCLVKYDALKDFL